MGLTLTSLHKKYIIFLIGVFFCILPLHASQLSDENGVLERESSDHSSIIFNSKDNDPDVLTEIAKAMGAFDVLDKNNSYSELINPNDLAELPIGIRENRDNVEYGIVVTKAKFTPEYALINVYARVVTPQQGMEGGKKELYFGAEGVKLGYSGKIIGEAKLSLLGNINIPFNQNKWMLTLEGGKINKIGGGESYNENTYVIIDCDGVKELSLKGNIQISRDLLTPLDINGKVVDKLPNGSLNRVRGDFALKAADWNDLLVKVSITPFAITSQVEKQDKGYFSFFVNDAILDLSDLRTDPSVQFPEYYQKHGYLIDGPNSWRGIYIQSLKVGLPEEFKTKDKKDAPVTLSAENLLIDNYGVSGSFAAENVFPLEKGITNKNNAWGYSLDRIEVDLAASKIRGASLSGKIKLPIQKENKEENKEAVSGFLGYTGSISEEEYLISVTSLNDINFDLWKAKATIESGSSIEMRVVNKEFYPKAILNGKLAINAGDEDDPEEDNEKKILKFQEIKFEGLTLQTKPPYFTVKSFGAFGEQKIAGLPASISDIILVADGKQANLSFGITIGLQDKGFAASGILHINGEVLSENSTQQWKYKGFKLSKLALENVDIGVATVSGSLEIMKKDPLYGDGFKAFLNAKLTGLQKVEVSVNAVFGYSTFRYWGFEGSVNGLKIPAGTVQITGFSGGAFYHMVPDREQTLNPVYKDKALVLKPDNSVGLALRAGVYGNLYNDGIASFMAGFNMSTNANGGLANMGFMGEVFIMEDITAVLPDPFAGVKGKFKEIVGKSNFIKDLSENNRVNSFLDVEKVDDSYPKATKITSALYGKLAMNYDFNNKVFHANLDVYVNVANGIVKGVGSGGRAGWAVLHIAPKDWYMYIGTPNDMIGLRVGLKNFYVESSSYFMVGSSIPDSPPPPAEVAQILGLDISDLDYMKDLNSLADGKGFAFGTHFKFDTGDMTALFLYARFQAGLGADIMLRNYGEDARCSNRGGDRIGINGWYANGQAYIYLQGELGIKIKLFFIKKKIPIIKAGAAALLQVKAPNPIWMRGYLGGYYNLLGGLIKGRFRFKLEFGEECKLENESVLGGIKIISDLTPQKEGKDIDVFAIPQATFAFKINDAFIIPEDDGDHTYKIIVDKFTMTDENGNEIKGNVEYPNSGDIANLVSDDILPPDKRLKAMVQVSFMEKKNGIYEVVTDNGRKATETEERWFTTGTAPNVIPLTNIQYAYPVVNQENYYVKESNSGYIKLKRGQDYLFDDVNWETITQFKDVSGKVKMTDFSYDLADNKVVFTVPNIDKQKEHTLSIIAKKTKNNTGNQQQTTTAVTTTGNEDSEDESSMDMETTTKLAAQISKDGEIDRLSFTFRTSKYNTLSDKIGSLKFNPLWIKVTSDVITLQNNMNADEYFDVTELTGSQYTDNKPLVNITALMEDPFAGKFKGLIYNNYPLDGLTLDRATSDDNTIGIPPANALPIFNAYLLYLDKEKGNSFLKQTFPYQYDLFRYYKLDWYELISKAAAKYVDTPLNARPQKINDVMSSDYGIIPKMRYKAKIQYILPGSKSGSVKEMNYEYK
ncbi:hypothetical protein FACS1894169_04650 [Bacteroidia bacterium]|nr:hypothetical protein FACS1894169_04650 [Bacteroidia bacterium]